MSKVFVFANKFLVDPPRVVTRVKLLKHIDCLHPDNLGVNAIVPVLAANDRKPREALDHSIFVIPIKSFLALVH